MAALGDKSDKLAVQHHETLTSSEESLGRRGSAAVEIAHTEAPVWEQRETYGKGGKFQSLVRQSAVADFFL